MSETTIRPGRADELGVAIAIDDDAWLAYVERDARYAIDRDEDHPFIRAELARWVAAAAAGRMLFACALDQTPVGLVILDTVDGAPHLQQVSVRRAWGRRGIGRMLVEHAVRWSAGRDLWLTTYDHVPWNRPWYERLGFVAISIRDCGSETRAIVELERSALPDPDHRIAMVHRAGERAAR